MAVMNKPDGKVFASSAKQGEVATFPDLLRGWGFTFEQTAGVPAMEHFNDLFKRLDETNLYQLQRGLPEWQSSIDYPVNAFVQHNGKCYRSLKTGVNKSPETATTYWTQWGIDFSQLTPQKISAGTNNVVSQTGHTHEIDLASLTTKGLVQLTNDTGLDSESLALTAKGAKTLAQQIAQNKLAVDSGFIQNGKKSSSISSTSTDTVATSSAVKTAYDKGVEAKNAADNAQAAAEAAYQVDTANQNQNLNNLLGNNTVFGTSGRSASVTGLGNIYNYGVGLSIKSSGANGMIYIPHSGSANRGVWVQSSFQGNTENPLWRRIDGSDWDEIRNNPLSNNNGTLFYSGRYYSIKATSSIYAGLEIVRDGGYTARFEQLPDRRWKFWTNSDGKGFEQYLPAQSGTILLDVDASTDVTANKLVKRDGSQDVHGRLFRATYADESRINGAIAFRVNNSSDNYTRYCNNPGAVRNWLGINDIATNNITRKTYSKTIAGTRSGYTAKTAAVSGEVITHPDGTIEQYFKVSAASVYWFTDEPTATAGDRGITFNMPLWTAMPNKILHATVQVCRPAANNVTYLAEAGEWVGAWSMKEQGAAKNAVYFNFRRFSGDSNEQIDIYIKVEGY